MSIDMFESQSGVSVDFGGCQHDASDPEAEPAEGDEVVRCSDWLTRLALTGEKKNKMLKKEYAKNHYHRITDAKNASQ